MNEPTMRGCRAKCQAIKEYSEGVARAMTADLENMKATIKMMESSMSLIDLMEKGDVTHQSEQLDWAKIDRQLDRIGNAVGFSQEAQLLVTRQMEEFRELTDRVADEFCS
jgi:hypothetical protein